ncbi:putative thiosulfate sulfurtransferase, mitochondrial [Hyposmocoma kahamanoa]|uniref:putative thiosulfate sulfurtransferase, mitochondrial n=1 Tax=Hyposmocoma kahamanoa TaxID=1477025 RepID=UPI000E6D9B05|nr:putative thiosulfate sulfurtransferase, mitochondrial [Hyposmocoma kahamanoa]
MNCYEIIWHFFYINKINMKLFLINIALFGGIVCVRACACDAENKYAKPKTGFERVNFEYVKKASDNGKILIIDVREPCETKNGIIPNSINIPIGRFAEDLGPMMSEEEFQERYLRPKPKKDSEFIIYCKLGKRSTIASNQAVDLGYTNVKNYIGSWTEWILRIHSISV